MTTLTIYNKAPMKLIELIGLLKSLESAESFINTTLPGVDFDQVDTYLKDSFNVHSEVAHDEISERILQYVRSDA